MMPQQIIAFKTMVVTLVKQVKAYVDKVKEVPDRVQKFILEQVSRPPKHLPAPLQDVRSPDDNIRQQG